MKKTLYAIYGRANSGKSTTINLILDKIKEVGNDYEIILEQKWGIEFVVIIKINSLTIGLVTIGDHANEVKKHLPKLVNANCDIIICATRTKGGTCWTVEEFGKSYEIKWIKKALSVSGERNDELTKNTETMMEVWKEIGVLF